MSSSQTSEKVAMAGLYGAGASIVMMGSTYTSAVAHGRIDSNGDTIRGKHATVMKLAFGTWTVSMGVALLGIIGMLKR